ncbi:MAG: DNA-3-methyladenine glycosylase 2 family protein [Methanophagales archaeon]|nr:DNA-3-methyladenine glycosylase 2 family protein [Methanophagales archaeon]
MDKTSFELIPTPPYNFDLQWKFYYSSKEPQPEIYKDGIWRRAFKIGDRLVPVAVISIGTVEKPKLRVNVFSKLNTKEKKDISNKITDIFRLKDDLKELYNFMNKDKVLLGIESKLYGLRPPGIGENIFEGAIRVIIQQQISLQVAYVMTGALVRRFGEKIEINGESYYDFPSPQVLAAADENDLRKCKLSRQKSKYIKELALEVANGYDLERIGEMNNEEAIEELMKFKGIGRWTAELILITSLGRMDLCVPDDLGARKAVSYFYFDGKLQSGDAVRKFTERWGKFRGWVIYYLICDYRGCPIIKQLFQSGVARLGL